MRKLGRAIGNNGLKHCFCGIRYLPLDERATCSGWAFRTSAFAVGRSGTGKVGKRPICQASDSVVGPWDSGWNGLPALPTLPIASHLSQASNCRMVLGALTVRSALLNGVEQCGLPYVIQAQWLQTKVDPAAWTQVQLASSIRPLLSKGFLAKGGRPTSLKPPASPARSGGNMGSVCCLLKLLLAALREPSSDTLPSLFRELQGL